MYFTTKPLCALASFGLFCMVLTPMTAALVTVALTYAVILHQKKALIQKPAAPGPSPWPVLGSLHLMDGYRVISKSTLKQQSFSKMLLSLDTLCCFHEFSQALWKCFFHEVRIILVCCCQ